MDNSNTNLLIFAIQEERIDTIRFILKCGVPVGEDILQTAIETDNAEIIELFVDRMKTELPVRNFLAEAKSVETAKWLIEQGFPVDQPSSLSKLLPYEASEIPEVAAYLKERWLKLHPPLPAVIPHSGTGAGAEEELQFSNSQMTIQELHPVDCDPAKGTFSIEYNGEVFQVTKRFLSSFARKLKVSTNIFRYFSGEEVFDRVAKYNPDLRLRATFDHLTGEILGVVDANKKILPPEIAHRIFAEDPRTQELQYRDGIISAWMVLDENFSIAGDSDYSRRLTLHYPVDGVSLPSFYLAVERLICSNGATMLTDAFRTEIEVNDNSGTHLSRLVSSFSNEHGFRTMQSRLRVAHETRASIHELLVVQELIQTLITSKSMYSRVNERLEQMAGDPCAQYEVTSLNNINTKRRPLLPVQCSVSDLINFCSELATHHGKEFSSPERIDVLIGRMLSHEFDLEDMYHTRKTAQAFFLENLESANLTEEFAG